MEEKKLWFKAKRYGWGWYPVTWQGWAVTLGYIIILFAFVSTIDEKSPTKEVSLMFFLPVAILTAALLVICYKKGEKPSWRWGGKRFDEKDQG